MEVYAEEITLIDGASATTYYNFMSLIPGTLPSDSCFGTPQEVLELFAQYLDIPAFAVSSRVLYSDTSPLPSTDFIWVDTTGSQNNVLKIYNTIASTYQEYPLAGTAGSPNTLIDGKSTIPAPLTGADKTLVSVSGVLYRATLAELSVGVLASSSVTYPMLSTSATEANNVAKRIAKAWVMFNGGNLTAYPTQSFNISSIARIAGATTGGFRVSFTTAMPAANYSVLGTVGAGNEVWNNVGAACVRVVGATTGYVDFVTVAQNSNAIDFGYTSIAVLSS
jgi:hypothetical protein